MDTNLKNGMCEELGDVLLQVVMHAEIAAETGEFTMEDVIDGIAKLCHSLHACCGDRHFFIGMYRIWIRFKLLNI